MTQLEALQEARRRWTQFGLAVAYISAHPKRPFTVGIAGTYPWIIGVGTSWEAAFADADRKEATK